MDLYTARNRVLTTLKNQDYGSYINQAFFPNAVKDGYLGLKAVSLELSQINSKVSEPKIGKLRLQFWRDQVNRLYNGAPFAQEASLTLLNSTTKHPSSSLLKNFILKAIRSRENRLGDPPFADLDSVAQNGENCVSPFLYCESELVGISGTIDHILTNIGQCSGIVTLLRGFPILLRNGIINLPIDLCAKYTIRQEDLIRSPVATDALKDCVFEIATRANDHMITARSFLKELESPLIKPYSCLILDALPLQYYLKNLEKANFDPFNIRPLRSQWTYPLKAYYAYNKCTI
ncbi:hypothetical protein CANCADRAFT_2519 [Tortispora caseinolytica NRRL Y-17796]|uniref:NADH dehydrogenase (Ubiquinone) complex I, assembly factor 6 n=1 Tax=Tortispora caseinolytica NRRL Y-17796 TaxID=767744 RepID=A0A1E4TGG0_9ASCO|nr:hypothetical protein CANCADRAFT_2519 [Tortispora caseinolytica NRRL Y-17796]